MNKILELAMKHGALANVSGTCGYVSVNWTPDELQAFAAELVAPYVEALKKIDNETIDHTACVIVRKTLQVHSAMFGKDGE